MLCRIINPYITLQEHFLCNFFLNFHILCIIAFCWLFIVWLVLFSFHRPIPWLLSQLHSLSVSSVSVVIFTLIESKKEGSHQCTKIFWFNANHVFLTYIQFSHKYGHYYSYSYSGYISSLTHQDDYEKARSNSINKPYIQNNNGIDKEQCTCDHLA